jgi:hypothetical protein
MGGSTPEQWIKEGKQAVARTRLSCHRFRANEVRLWLSVIAYNLGNLWRRLALPAPIGRCSLTALQRRICFCCGLATAGPAFRTPASVPTCYLKPEH